MTPQPVPLDHKPIAVRAFAERAEVRPPRGATYSGSGAWVKPLPPSEWTLVFDTETTVDEVQQLRFGTYRVYRGELLHDAGAFYDPAALSEAETSLLMEVCQNERWSVFSHSDWIETVFLKYTLDLGGRCVGFNLPFDISRIATDSATARGGSMRGGFSFKLSENEERPRLQVKHLNQRASFIRFTAPRGQNTPRSFRKQRKRLATVRGTFIDVSTLAGSLLGGRSWSLDALCQNLKVQNPKHHTDEHGQQLTVAYIQYAMADVAATWDCFMELQRRYAKWGLSTPAERLYSEASLGKALLKDMGVKPWREVQPDFPSSIVGIIMSTYYGGRSEVKWRRETCEVLYADFLSMYPTVCTNMGLWEFVRSDGVDTEDATTSVRELLNDTDVQDWQNPSNWRQLHFLVQVIPEDDIFPVRAKYDGGSSYTIGVNRLTSEQPLWFTLADCVASKLLTGKPPKVVQAVKFSSRHVQDGLATVTLMGDSNFNINPERDDLYRRLIDMRQAVKRDQKQAKRDGQTEEAARLDAAQLALKILANSISYGAFVEINPEDENRLIEVRGYGPSDESFTGWTPTVEEPGRYFHPLLATLITGAARLMLSVVEKLATDNGLLWAFCDTDSMALARPQGMNQGMFRTLAQEVTHWFQPLNPYEDKSNEVFKLEDANFAVNNSVELEPLFCFAVAPKRYVLFNIDSKGRPILRKASAHGLGHLRAPYTDVDAPRSVPKPVVSPHELGVHRWQHDVWWLIAKAALDGHPDQVRFDKLPGFDKPAASRYAATTPELLHWFDKHNGKRQYPARVKPFGFMLAFQPRTMTAIDRQGTNRKHASDIPRPVAPYNPDPAQGARHAFDRMTGDMVPIDAIKSYSEALARYHLNPEPKFLIGEFLDHGLTERRHIHVTAVQLIGKEANRWEEQFFLGENPERQIVYGSTQSDVDSLRQRALAACKPFTVAQLAKASHIERTKVHRMIQGASKGSVELWSKLLKCAQDLEQNRKQELETVELLRERCRNEGIRAVAQELEIDPRHLSAVLRGKRKSTGRSFTGI